MDVAVALASAVAVAGAGGSFLTHSEGNKQKTVQFRLSWGLRLCALEDSALSWQPAAAVERSSAAAVLTCVASPRRLTQARVGWQQDAENDEVWRGTGRKKTLQGKEVTFLSTN